MLAKARSITFIFVVCVVLVGLFAGCSGGGTGQEDQQGGQKSGGEQGGEATQVEAAQGAKGAPQAKIALGIIKRVNYENRKLVLRPSQGEGLVTFKVVNEATITLDDKQAELADAKEGQNAQIEYVVKNEKNRARSVKLFSPDGAGG